MMKITPTRTPTPAPILRPEWDEVLPGGEPNGVENGMEDAREEDMSTGNMFAEVNGICETVLDRVSSELEGVVDLSATVVLLII